MVSVAFNSRVLPLVLFFCPFNSNSNPRLSMTQKRVNREREVRARAPSFRAMIAALLSFAGFRSIHNYSIYPNSSFAALSLQAFGAFVQPPYSHPLR